jgi:hypothetical protein
MKFIERVKNLKKTREVYTSSIETLINIYDQAPKEKQNELNNLDEKGFDDLLKSLKINIEQKSVFKDYIKSKGGDWHPILLYIFSNFIYIIFFSDNGIQNIGLAIVESMLSHFFSSLFAIIIIIMIIFDAYRKALHPSKPRKFRFWLMVTLIIIKWSLDAYINYIRSDLENYMLLNNL